MAAPNHRPKPVLPSLPPLTIALAVMALAAPPAAPAIEITDATFATDGDRTPIALQTHGDTVHMVTIDNMRAGHGQGENLIHWQRRLGEADWRSSPRFPDHHPGMLSLLPLGDDDTLFLYVDRRDERRRRVHLQRVQGERETSLFEFSDNSGVLNPTIDRLDDGRLLVLIPDRTATSVRRFLVDDGGDGHQRLDDIATPRPGARIYQRLRDGDRLLVPLAVVGELLMLEIDLADHDHQLRSIDTFTSASNEPPRNMRLFPMPEHDRIVLVYLRPAEFSDRQGRRGEATGLVGEIVLRVLDRDFDTVAETILAGQEAGRAATHNLAVAMPEPGRLVLGHTEVDRIHLRHLTGEPGNYVGGFVSEWRIGSDARADRVRQLELDPFFATRLAPLPDGSLMMAGNRAIPGAPLVVSRLALR